MLRFLTAGESHGPALLAILEGLPAGLALSEEEINLELRRRQQGLGSSARMQMERDMVQIAGGLADGRTTGAPLGLIIENQDVRPPSGEAVTVPRPGHADLAAALKYGYYDLRLAAERASARETAARVAVGAVCKQLLTELGVTVGGYVTQIGPVIASLPEEVDCLPFVIRFIRAEASPVRCPDEEASTAMARAIAGAEAEGDTLGGVLEIVALNLLPGLGSHVHWDRRLDARLAAALLSIPAVKGVECGPAFQLAGQRGSRVHDPFLVENGAWRRVTNRAGGLEGGLSNGAPLHLRAAMKPLPTLQPPLPSVDLATGRPATAPPVRSDCCAVPRAVVVGEAMVAFVLAQAILERVGGDTLDQVRCRWQALASSPATVIRAGDSPPLLILTGFMGTGKTAVGQRVARRLDRPFVDMDAAIEAGYGLTVGQIFAAYGEKAFRWAEAALCRDLARRRGLVVATGGGTLLSAENRRTMVAAGPVVCLTARPEVIAARLAGMADRPLLQLAAGQTLQERVAELLTQRREAYAALPHQVDTSELSLEEVVEAVLEIWQQTSEVWGESKR